MTVHLAGKRILVIEDEYFIASDLKRALADVDAIVVGPAASASDGMQLLADGPVDAAVLDVNLDGGRSFALAEQLRRNDVPYLFLTGYDEWSLPVEHRVAPRLAKPFATPAVLKVLDDMCGLSGGT